MKVNGFPLEIKIDTGTAVNVVSKTTLERNLTQKPCLLVSKGYPGNELDTLCVVMSKYRLGSHKTSGTDSV